MSQLPPEAVVQLAQRLLHHEAAKTGTPDDIANGFEPVVRALHARLSPLISAYGFGTLLSRALKLAAREFPWLSSLKVTVTDDDCTISTLPGSHPRSATGDDAEALVDAVAQFIWLLVIFIGEDLSLRKVREIWPEVPFGREKSSRVGE